MEEAYKEGKLRAIGVSNFLVDDLENIINNCEIKPMANQILLHIGETPVDVIMAYLVFHLTNASKITVSVISLQSITRDIHTNQMTQMAMILLNISMSF